MNKEEQKVYDKNVKVRALAHDLEPPRHENSLYAATTADLSSRFPGQKGFMVHPQFRLGPIARDGEPHTIDPLGTPCRWSKSDFSTPDAVVTYVPYGFARPPAANEHYTKLPVLLQEAKTHCLPEYLAAEFDAYERQIVRDLRRINMPAVRNSAAVQPYREIIEHQPCHGVLVVGSRCFRFEVTIAENGTPRVARLDDLDSEVLIYYEHETELSRWTTRLREAFEDFNPPGISDNQRYPAFVIHDLNATSYADYEAYLYGPVYMALAYRWKLASGYFVKPQGMLYRSKRSKEHSHTNSYDQVVDDKGKAPDFMLSVFSAMRDSAFLICEVKRNADNSYRSLAKDGIEKYMNLVQRVSKKLVPGLVILGTLCWYIPWTARGNGENQVMVPKTQVMYQVKRLEVPPEVGVPLSTIFEEDHPFWAQYDNDWQIRHGADDNMDID